MNDHDQHTAHGLPEPLPPGERILWQGRPDWRVLARTAFHVRKVAVYFGVLMAWRVASQMYDGHALGDALAASARLLPLALAAVGLLALLAWASARTTLYTITSRRVVMRIGIALPITLNVPFRIIEAAGLRRRARGTGDLALTLDGPGRVAFLHLWPHARPWRIARPQPMLRAVPDAAEVAAILAPAIAKAGGSESAARTAVHLPTGTLEAPPATEPADRAMPLQPLTAAAS